MPRHPRYVKNKGVGQRGTIIRGDQIHVPFGGLIGGATGQGLHDASVLQRYNLGTRRITPDGRVFRYGRVGPINAIQSMKRGVFNAHWLVTELATIVDPAAIGDTLLKVTFNGDFWDKALAIDELKGGYISIYNTSAVRDQRMIISNTTVDAAGGACFIGIDDGLSIGFAAAVNCEVLANPYSKLENPGAGGDAAVMGMPACNATVSQYFWIQTWGVCRISPSGAEWGVELMDKQVVFAPNGSIMVSTDAPDSYQHAGFVVKRVAGTVGSAAPFIMLQISP